MKRYVLAGLAILLAATPERAMASDSASVSISTSGGVTFPAANPSIQPVTPASTSLVATITINGAKNGNSWALTIRGEFKFHRNERRPDPHFKCSLDSDFGRH